MDETELPPPTRPLTQKEAKALEVFLSNGGNMSAAYRAAYNTQMNDKAVYVAAKRLFQKPPLARELAKARQLAERKVDDVIERYGVTQESIAKILVTLAAYDIRDICDLRTVTAEDGTKRKELEVRDFADIGTRERMAITAIEIDAKGRVKVNLADRRQSAVDLAKLMGLITDKGQQAVDPVTGKPVDRFQPIELHIHRNGNGGSR